MGYKHTSATQETVSVDADVAVVTEHRSVLQRGDNGDTHACGLRGQTEGWNQQGMQRGIENTGLRKPRHFQLSVLDTGKGGGRNLIDRPFPGHQIILIKT